MGGKDFDVAKAIGGQRGDRCKFTDAVKWGIDDFEIARPGRALADHVLNERLIDLVLTENDFAVGYGLPEIGALDLGDIHHALDDRLVVRRDDLAASGPVDLDRVIARRIVAGGNHDAAVALLVPHEERQLRRAAVIVEEIDDESVGHHDRRAQLGETAGVVARVVGEGARRRSSGEGRVVSGEYVIGQALGTFAYRPVVDGVRADGVHAAAATAGAEGNDGPEGVVQLLPLFGGNVLGDLRRVIHISRLGEPAANVGSG